MKHLFFGVLLLAMTTSSSGQIVLSSTTPYNQNFNTLRSTGTNTALPAGWFLLETGTGANTSYAADAGSSTTGNTFSYGATRNTERAFGMLGSGTVQSQIGAYFINTTGATITQITISFTGEQWRTGAVNRTDKLDFQYSLNATSLATGSWTDADLLDFNGIPNGTVGAKNGNSASFRRTVTAPLTNLSIPTNTTFFIKWKVLQ